MRLKEKNLLILLGPTGVGKSVTAVKLSRELSGEVINCDSMQVYKGFDTGTDKLPIEKRENIPHHLLDICDPHEQFTAAAFVKHALKAIQIIHKKMRLPVITGGTGLYLKALLDGLFPEEKKNPSLRQKLEKEAAEKGLESLSKKLKEVDPAYHRKIGKNDRVRIIRALEVFYNTDKALSEHFLSTRSFVSDFHTQKIGLKLERQELYKRIEERVNKMFENGIVQEVENLLQSGVHEDSPPFRALGYKHVLQYLKKEMSLEDAIASTKKDTRHYAKRQMTWFRKMEGIIWFFPDDYSALKKYVETGLK